MNKAIVYNQAGEKVSEMDLNPKIFGITELDANIVHTAVVAQQTNSRGSIAHTKNRGEVSGSGKKPWKQKGTGRARAGSIRSPLWRHGGVTFGPRSQRNWSVKLNRSAFKKALFTILTDKIKYGKIAVIDKLETVSKSKELSGLLNRIGVKADLGSKFLLIIADHNKEIERAAQNLSNIKVLTANQLNVVDLMNYNPIVTKDALGVIEKTYLK